MQRAKGHANQSGVRNGTETNELENVNNWTHQNYNAAANASMAVAAGAYPLSNYYGPASYHYPATYCVSGEGTAPNAWPNNDPAITYVGNYNGQLTTTDAAAAAAAYAMDGMYGAAAYGNPYAAAANAPTGAHNSSYNYFTAAAGNVGTNPADYAPAAPWGTTAAKHYENYYRETPAIDGVAMYNGVDPTIAMKSIDHNLRSLDLNSGTSVDPNSSQKRYAARSYGDVLNRTDAFLNAAALSAAASSTTNATAVSEKKTTWASIAKQPAKPVPQTSSSGSKKKGPGMPPPPMVPGRHNIDLNTWEVKNNPPKTPVAQAPPPPVTASVNSLAKPVWNGPELRPPSQNLPNAFDPTDVGLQGPHHYDEPANSSSKSQPTISVASTHSQIPPPSYQKPLPNATTSSASVPHSTNCPPHQSPPLSNSSPPILPSSSSSSSSMPLSHQRSSTSTSATSSSCSSSYPLPVVANQNNNGYGSNNNNNNNNNNNYSNRNRKTRNDSTSSGGNNNNNINNFNSDGSDKNRTKSAHTTVSNNNNNNDSSGYDTNRLSSSSNDSTLPPHSVVDKLKDKNNYNPVELELPPRGTRFFVIKSYSEDDVHRSIKYEIWCSTEHGNKRLDEAYEDQKLAGGSVYLFFSVNGSGHFCGVAQMISSVDYGASSSVWAQDKWKGQFKVRWIYVKDVPNSHLRHIKLENNENKPVTNSRDTQEVPYDKGVNVLKIIHAYMHTTSIFDDFTHYEKRQEEGDNGKRGGAGAGPPPPSGYHQGGSSFSSQSYQPYRNSAFGGKNSSNRDRNGGGNYTMTSYNRRGGGRNNYGSSFNMDSSNSRSNRIEF